ncbi:antibiotic biosynthesis monooxygenase family protein [Raineyella fluvialis]|uniref:Antibiotic biosynthesis monooxygenase n=1 Tax=Raineyella fluvialis TaxID=2662261 RepID=A0A5Q2FI67_9ACTN|nr:antibiotic biosynthesis monooxygenase family protein [Raineyella fluvialis]QGF24355.1 antibiotic biosynthesis monooxygenase [Raineyella fluvialis]
MLVIHRFHVPEGRTADFETAAGAAVAHFRTRPGVDGVDLVRNLDEPGLWALVTRWADPGSYRRAISGAAATYALMPVMAYALDEPSAYLPAEELGENVPRGAD